MGTWGRRVGAGRRAGAGCRAGAGRRAGSGVASLDRRLRSHADGA